MNAVSLNNLWSYLQGLSLSASNQRWLGERLIEAPPTCYSNKRRGIEVEETECSFRSVERSGG